MRVDLGGVGELESAGAAEQIVQHYDSETGTWSLKLNSPFWEAVKIAHTAHRTGHGVSIAILDGWCDTSIPVLRKQVRSLQVSDGAVPTAIAHGTAVALLINAVAPDAVIDFYGICNAFGLPQPRSVAAALDAAVDSDVDVINLSAGRPRSWLDTLQAHHALPSGFGVLGLPDEASNPPEDCLWCGPVDRAAASGKLIVAAVGNDINKVYCPARSPNVIATGFHIEQRYMQSDTEGDYEVGASNQPTGYSQSSEVAYTISQPPDAIGSSFGAPLLTGALALGVHSDDMANWLKARTVGSNAQVALYADDARPEKVASLLAQAWHQSPHDHAADTHPQPCFECSLFLEALYTVDSLHWLLTGAYDMAHQRLMTAQHILPWSPHAFVNFGNLLERLAEEAPPETDTQPLIAEAVRQYVRALDGTPPSRIAAQRLAVLRGRTP